MLTPTENPHLVNIPSTPTPLVVRLRERGIKVVCVSERSKMASEAVYAYDKVLFVANQKAGSTDSTMDDAGSSVHVRTKAADTTTAKTTPVKKAAAKMPPTKNTAEKRLDTNAPAAPVDKTSVSAILAAVPNLKAGEWLHLSDAAKALHDSKLLGKNASTTKLFNKHPDQFELTPKKQPNKVRYVTPSGKG